MKFLPHCLAAATLAFPSVVQGDSPPAPAMADPARSDVPVRAIDYRSPLASYRPHVAVTPGPWRAMNDEVARIGGWKAYAREAHEAAAAGASPDARALAPGAPAPRAGSR